MSDRGQSELVGFILIFGIMIFSIILLSSTGFAGLHSAQDYQRTSNIQPAFEVFSDNVDDIVHRGVPSRATEIKLSDASLSIEEAVEITVEGDNFTSNYTVHSIVYDSGSGTEYHYENGLLVRKKNGHITSVKQPNFVFTEEGVVLSIVELDSVGAEKVGGSQTVLVEMRHAKTKVVRHDQIEQLKIEVTSEHPDLWNEYLTAEASDACEVDNTVVTCEPDQIYIISERIGVSFS